MSKEKKLWIGLVLVAVFSFGVLGYFGYEIYQQSPPVPEKIISDNKEVIFTNQEIKDGQNVWQSMGGQEVGYGDTALM
jgi:nitric oxide reductase subunit B